MNWLAHLVLSPPHAEDRVGNWLADVLPAGEIERLGGGFARGLAIHREIDRFTDRHPVTARSRQRFPRGMGLVSGVFVDIFYDHFLTCQFPTLTGSSLAAFLHTVQCDFAAVSCRLPSPAAEIVERMFTENWLGSYGTTGGVELALTRIRRRLSPRAAAIFDPAAGRSVLEAAYDGFAADFTCFWPDLSRAVSPANQKEGVPVAGRPPS